MERSKAYFIEDVPAADRFLLGDKPTEQVFRDLFDSLRFGPDASDSAGNSKHGLIKIATAAQILARAAADAGGFTLGMRPDQMPIARHKSGGSLTSAIIQEGDKLVYEFDDAVLRAAIAAAITAIPSFGAWVNIAAYTTGSIDGEFEAACNNASGVTRARVYGDGIQLQGRVYYTGASAMVNSQMFKVPLAMRPATLFTGEGIAESLISGEVLPTYIEIGTNGFVRAFPKMYLPGTLWMNNTVFLFNLLYKLAA